MSSAGSVGSPAVLTPELWNDGHLIAAQLSACVGGQMQQVQAQVQAQLAQVSAQLEQGAQLQQTTMQQLLQQVMQHQDQQQQQHQLLVQQQQQQHQLLMQQQLALLQSLRPQPPTPVPRGDAGARLEQFEGQLHRARRLGRRERQRNQDHQGRMQRSMGTSDTEHVDVAEAAFQKGEPGTPHPTPAPVESEEASGNPKAGHAGGSSSQWALSHTVPEVTLKAATLERLTPDGSDNSGAATEDGWTRINGGAAAVDSCALYTASACSGSRNCSIDAASKETGILDGTSPCKVSEELQAAEVEDTATAQLAACASASASVAGVQDEPRALRQCRTSEGKMSLEGPDASQVRASSETASGKKVPEAPEAEPSLRALLMAVSTSVDKLHDFNASLTTRVAALEASLTPASAATECLAGETATLVPEGGEESLAVMVTPEPTIEPLPIGLLFPGEGSQYAKMLSSIRDLPTVREMLEKARNLFGVDVLELCMQEPADKLNTPPNCQLAMFIAGLAGLEKLKQDREEAVCRAQAMAGMGVGELTALCAAGVVSFEDGLRLAQARGVWFMNRQGPGQLLLSVAGLDKAQLEELCVQAVRSEGKAAVCQIAVELCPKGFSVVGTHCAIEKLKDLCERAGALQAKLLKTRWYAACTQLMQPAFECMERAFDDILPSMKSPRCKVYMNATAAPLTPGMPPADILDIMKHQLKSRILWEQSVRNMIKDGVSEFYEVGPMKQLKAMMKRIDSKIFSTTWNVQV